MRFQCNRPDTVDASKFSARFLAGGTPFGVEAKAMARSLLSSLAAGCSEVRSCVEF